MKLIRDDDTVIEYRGEHLYIIPDISSNYTTSFAADIGMFDHYRKVWDRENGYH